MSLRFTSQLNIDNLPDEQLDNQFEVIMPSIDISFSETTLGLFKQLETMSSWYSYTPIVEEIVFGTRNFTTDSRRVRTGWFNVPNDIEKFHEAKITMFCPASMITQYYLEAWKKLIFNDQGEYYYPFSHYKKNIEIYIYGPMGNTAGITNLIPECHITLQGCFPFSQKDYEFEYKEDPKRLRILATFNVDNVKIDTSVGKNALNREFITSPTSILDKGLSMLNSSSTYDIETTYGGKRTNNKGSILSNVLNSGKSIF